MTETRIADHLAAFGFSRKEIDTYLAVLRRGQATTGDVADAADVSQGYVYEVAETLVDRGLVTIDEGASPTVLRARPAAEAIAELSSRLSDLQSDIEDVYSEPAAVDVGFEVIRSRQTVERRTRRFLDEAVHEVYLVLPATSFERVREAVADAVDRGVYVYLLLVEPDVDVVVDAVEDFGRYATVVQTWDARPQIFVLRDTQSGLVGTHRVLTGRHSDDYAVAFGQSEVANGFYGNMLGNAWPMAEPYFLADPPDLPATFDYFRNGVTTVARYHNRGRDLVADADVTDTSDDSSRTLTDVPVREARQNLVDPPNSSFPVENALVVETDEGTATLGGNQEGFDAFYEDFVAHSLTLRPA